jgi:hypothetical protein
MPASLWIRKLCRGLMIVVMIGRPGKSAYVQPLNAERMQEFYRWIL